MYDACILYGSSSLHIATSLYYYSSTLGQQLPTALLVAVAKCIMLLVTADGQDADREVGSKNGEARDLHQYWAKYKTQENRFNPTDSLTEECQVGFTESDGRNNSCNNDI